MKAKLALENGAVFTGESFGAETETAGEVVFNTGMTGYQEIITDPSYNGQIVTMTYPLIGNYGVNAEDIESNGPKAAGFVVREYSPFYSNFRANTSLAEWLKRNSIPAIEGIDTRMLTKMLRTKGAMRGVLSAIDLDDARLVKKAQESPMMAGLDLACRVTTGGEYAWTEIDRTPFALAPAQAAPAGRTFHVLVFDYGVKQNILRRLTMHGCNISVVPASMDAGEILKLKPDGIFLSNGPGDPAAVTYAIATIKKLIGRTPMFGICLGHQLLALALGAKTYKLKFGHRGSNHPVKNLVRNTIEITSQNHGFAVDPDSFGPDIDITHVNLNDQTNEGFRHRSLPLFSVQYHPEASPGPHDSDYLFGEFTALMHQAK